MTTTLPRKMNRQEVRKNKELIHQQEVLEGYRTGHSDALREFYNLSWYRRLMFRYLINLPKDFKK